MAFPVFSSQSDPVSDRPLCRKRNAYIQSLLENRWAYWLDPQDRRKGVKLRAFCKFESDFEQIVAGSGFDSAWAIIQSGYAGPDVWQLKLQEYRTLEGR